MAVIQKKWYQQLLISNLRENYNSRFAIHSYIESMHVFNIASGH